MSIEHNKIKLIQINNPFKPYDNIILFKSFSPFLSSFLEKNNIDKTKYIISVNGKIVKDDINLTKNDTIVICPVIEGGGKSSRKTAYRIMAMVAVVIASYYTGQFVEGLGFAHSTFWGDVAAAAVQVGGTLAINKVLPPIKPNIPSVNKGDSADVSPAYGWEGPATLSSQGIVIPVLYGEFITGGNIIEDYLETINNKQYLNVLLALCNGKINDISTILINNNPVDNYSDIVYDIRTGTNDQSIIPFFKNTIINNPQNVLLSYNNSCTITTQGNSVNEVTFSLSAPSGLGITNDDGSISTHVVDFKIEYKKSTSNNWILYGPIIKQADINISKYATTKQNFITKKYYLFINSLLNGYEDITLDSIKLNFDIYGTGSGDSSETVFLFSRSLSPHTIDLDNNKAIFSYTYGPSPGNPGGLSVSGYITTKGNVYLSFGGPDPSNIRNIKLSFSYGKKIEFKGNSLNVLKKDITITFTEASKYDLRITRITPDDNSINVADKVYLTNVAEIVTKEFTYPCIALLGVKALATDKLSGGIPSFKITLDRGAFSSDDPGVIDYLIGKSSNNYAWAVLDLFTNKLYGGGIDISKIDTDAFEKWADYCDKNNLKCNIIFDAKFSIWDACLRLAMMGNAILIRQGTIISVVIEDITSRTQVFSVGNIVKDSFQITYLSKADRANYLECTYWDESNNFERTIFPVYTSDWSEKNNIKQSITLYGVTNYDQAVKIANRILRYNMYVTHTCSLSVEIDAISCTVGNVIGIQHDIVVDTFGGRIVEATYSYIQIDKKVPLEAGETYGIVIRLFNDEIISKTFTATTTENTDVLPIIFSTAETLPQKYDVYAFGNIKQELEDYRVTAIDRDGEQHIKISCVNYDERIYTDTDVIPPKPLNISEEYNIFDLKGEEEYIVFPGGTVGSQVKLTWTYNGSFVKKWLIYLKDFNTNETVLLGETKTTEFIAKYNFVYLNTYIFYVCYEDWTGKIQAITDAKYVIVTILGKSAPPEDIENFVVTQQNNFAVLRWDHIKDVDINYYQIREGISWGHGNIILDKISKNTAYYRLPVSGEYVFWIKAVDKYGNFSKNATKATLVANNIEELLNILIDQDEVVLHNGTENNLVFVDSDNYFAVPCSLDDMQVSDWTDITPAITNYSGDSNLVANYYSKLIDLGQDIQCSVGTKAISNLHPKSITDQTYPHRTDQSYPNDTDVSISTSFTLTENLWVSNESLTISEVVAVGDGTKTQFNISLTELPVDGTGILSYYIGTVKYQATDDGLGNITGTDVTGTINYISKVITLNFTVAPVNNIVFSYNYFKVCNNVSVISDNIRYLKNIFSIILDSYSTLAKIYSFKTIIDLPTKQKIINNVSIGTAGSLIKLDDYNIKFYKDYNIGIVPYGNYTYQISNKTLDSFTIELYNGTILTTGTIDIYLVGY